MNNILQGQKIDLEMTGSMNLALDDELRAEHNATA